MDTLIITAPLSFPPSESLAFRTLTMFSQSNLHMDVLVEVEKMFKDLYYNCLRTRGLLDFVEQFVTPEEHVEAIRVDTEPNYPLTIVTDCISFRNFNSLYGQIHSLRGLERKLKAGIY